VVARNGAGRRVLVVDDEPQVRATVTEALELEGYEVAQATNGMEALALLASREPEVIVLDLWMPVMDGWAFRRAQLVSHPHIPVIVLSALDLSSDQQSVLARDRQREIEAVDITRQLCVAAREPVGPARIFVRPERCDDRCNIGSRAAQPGREVLRAGVVLTAPENAALAHRDDRDLISDRREIEHRRLGDDEAPKYDLTSASRSDDALSARAGALHDAATGQVEMLDGRGRIPRVEPFDGLAADLSGEEERSIDPLHCERLLVIGHKHDLARARCDAERCRRERSEYVDDDRVTGSRASAVEKLRDANVHPVRVISPVATSYVTRGPWR